MLTNEQCIEIAEKVWGWKCKPHEDRVWYTFSGIDKFNYEYTYLIDWLRDEVLSWQGFGRTVEAMSLPVHGNFRKKAESIYSEYLLGLISKETLWEQTHLAALEALK